MNCLQASPQPRRALDGVRRRVGGNSNGSVRRPLAGDAERRAAMSSFNGFAVLHNGPTDLVAKLGTILKGCVAGPRTHMLHSTSLLQPTTLSIGSSPTGPTVVSRQVWPGRISCRGSRGLFSPHHERIHVSVIIWSKQGYPYVYML